MSNRKQGTAGFYVFTVSLIIVGALITIFGSAALFSGEILSQHLRFILWVAVVTFFCVAMLGLLRLLLDITSFFVHKFKKQ